MGYFFINSNHKSIEFLNQEFFYRSIIFLEALIVKSVKFLNQYFFYKSMVFLKTLIIKFIKSKTKLKII